MKKYIGISIIGIVVIICLAWIFLQENVTITGNVAEIRVDNEVVQTLDLNKNTRLTVQGKNNITLIVIVDSNSIYVESSECPDKICVNKGRISKEYETIVCLPAKTIIEIKNLSE